MTPRQWGNREVDLDRTECDGALNLVCSRGERGRRTRNPGLTRREWLLNSFTPGLARREREPKALNPATSRPERGRRALTLATSRPERGRGFLPLALFLAAMTSIAVLGCAPGLQALLDDHHFNEAVCAAQDSYDPHVESRVTSALEGDLNPAVHLSALGDAELRPLFGQWTEDILQRLVILHVTYEVNEAPLDEVHVSVALLGDGESLTWLYPSRENLAELMAETLPRPRLAQEPWAGAREAASMGAAVALPLATIIDLGTLDLFSLTERMEEQINNSSLQEHMVYPTDQEYRQQAPRSDLVYRLASGAFGPRYEEGIHHGYVFFERPTHQPARLQLEISLTYAADRIEESGLHLSQCLLFSDPIRFEIPDVTRTGEAVRGIFGQRMLTMDELRVLAGTGSR